MPTPLILVTNDDGVHADGIRALVAALGDLGEVHVVAPDREVSACSHSLTLKQPLRAQSIAPQVWAVDGTPADCVNLAIVKLLPASPNLVVSGINNGPNMGEDVFYSGTVGGAREGVFFGVPSIALSLAARGESDFTQAATFARILSDMVLVQGLPPHTLLNVNVPGGPLRGAAITVQGRRQHESHVLEGVDPRKRPYYWIEEVQDGWITDELSDVHAVRSGLVSVTPLSTDTTHHGAITPLRSWERALRGAMTSS